MRFVHPLVGIREIESLGVIPALTANHSEWVVSDAADAALTRLWIRLAERLTQAGAVVAAVDVCGGSPERIRRCHGWHEFPGTLSGPWSAEFASAVAESTTCWLEVRASNDHLLMLMDGGFDRMVVMDSGVQLDGVIEREV